MDDFSRSIWNNIVCPETGASDQAGPVLGLDFGSSNSCVSIWRPDKNRVKVIRNTTGAKTTPSLLQFTTNFDDVRIGQECERDSSASSLGGLKQLIQLTPEKVKQLQLQRSATATVDERFRGRCVPSMETAAPPQVDIDTLSVDQGVVYIECEDDQKKKRKFTVRELAGILMHYLKRCSEQYLDRKPFKTCNVIDREVVAAELQPKKSPSSSEFSSPAEAGLTIASRTKSENMMTSLNRVVLGVPVNFSEHCKSQLRMAAEYAGFSEVHFFVESTAAATAYGLMVAGRKNVLVFDMGGGTTDITIMSVADGRFQVRGTTGHNTLGGVNIDQLLYKHVLNEYQRQRHRIPNSSNSSVVDSTSDSISNSGVTRARQELLHRCKLCKEELSDTQEATIVVPIAVMVKLFADAPAPGQTAHSPTAGAAAAAEEQMGEKKGETKEDSFSLTVTRSQFDDIVRPVTDLVEATVAHALQQSKLKTAPGTTTSAPVAEVVTAGVAAGRGEKEEEEEEEEDYVTVPHSYEVSHSSPEDSSCMESGATSKGTKRSSNDNINGLQEIVLVGGSSRVPAVRLAIRRACRNMGFDDFSAEGGREFCTSMDPEQVVAEGLAIRGAVLGGVQAGKLKDLLVMDCLANTIGVMSWSEAEETSDHDSETISSSGSESSRIQHQQQQKESVRYFDAVVCKGKPLPATGSVCFTLASAEQKFVSLDIYEEIEECKVVSQRAAQNSRNLTTGGSTTAVAAGSKGADEMSASILQYETSYQYHLIATADVPVPQSVTLPVAAAAAAAAASTRSQQQPHIKQQQRVNVQFTITEDGVLKFDVVPVVSAERETEANAYSNNSSSSSNSGGGGDNQQQQSLQQQSTHNQNASEVVPVPVPVDQASAQSMLMLAMYAGLMLVLYIVVKLFLPVASLDSAALPVETAVNSLDRDL